MNRRGLWLLGLLLGVVLALPARAGDTVVYYLTDTLHSTVVVTDAQRNVIETTHYAPYGQVLNRPLRNGPGYGGHQEDAATGLVYMQQRYYDSESGRFLSPDPVQMDGNGGSFNRYAYAKDNPYRYIDPDGRYSRREEFMGSCNASQLTCQERWGQRQAGHTGTRGGGQSNAAAQASSSSAGAGAGAAATATVAVATWEQSAGRLAALLSDVSRVAGGALSVVMSTLMLSGDTPGPQFVVRGGLCAACNFSGGSGVTIDATGTCKAYQSRASRTHLSNS